MRVHRCHRSHQSQRSHRSDSEHQSNRWHALQPLPPLAPGRTADTPPPRPDALTAGTPPPRTSLVVPLPPHPTARTPQTHHHRTNTNPLGIDSNRHRTSRATRPAVPFGHRSATSVAANQCGPIVGQPRANPGQPGPRRRRGLPPGISGVPTGTSRLGVASSLVQFE